MTQSVSFYRRVGITISLAAVSLASGCKTTSDAHQEQVFATPNEAATVFLAALHKSDEKQLIAIFGPDAKEMLSSGDPVDDRRQREVVSAAAAQEWAVVDKYGDAKELVVGDERWPFPVPIVPEGSGWRFDTAAGIEEVLARRVGRNELVVINLCRAYVDAQNEYAAQSRDGHPAGAFAQRIRSDDGTRNGLYWPTTAGEPASPIGALVASATSDGYDNQNRDQPSPFHGYYFKILTGQGSDASGGAKSYVVNGQMTGGFGLFAYPADYGNSGVMSFMVDAAGVVYESDLGEDTLSAGKSFSTFNPSSAWKPAK